MNSKTKAILQLIATMFLVALVTVLAKKSLYEVQAFDFVWLQMVFAGVSICVYTFWFKREKIPTNIPIQAWLIVILMGICNFTLVRTFFILALEIMPVTTHAYLINFVGIMTMFLSALFLKEKPSFLQVTGALIAIAGIQIYFQILPSGNQAYGVALLVLAVLFLALTNIFMRLLHLKFPNVLSHNIVSSIAVVSGGLPLVLYGVQHWQRVLNIEASNWLIIAANGVIAMSLTMNVFNIVIKVLRAYEASILASTGLIFTALFSVPILGEVISYSQIAGITLLLVGIIMVQLYRKSIQM